MPESYIYKKQELIKGLSYTSTLIKYTSYGGSTLSETTQNNLKKSIVFSKKEKEVYKIEITYDGLIKQIHKHYRKINDQYEFLYQCEYIFEEDNITVKDYKTGYFTKITGSYTNKTFYPSLIETGYNTTNTNKIELRYTTYFTKLTNIKGTIKRTIDYHFVNDLLRKIVGDKGETKVFEYDQNKNKISESKYFYIDYPNSTKNSLLCDYFDNEVTP